MIKAEVRHPRALSEAELSAWRGFCAAEPAFSSPLLGPDFARLVGEVREDARVASFTRAGKPVGFLAFHQRPDGFAWPIGAAFSDYHALVSAPGEAICGPKALAAARISGMRFTGLVDPHGVFEGMHPSDHEGHVIALQGGAAEPHQQWLKAANPKRYKNWGRLRNRLERELGDVELMGADLSLESLDRLIGWKREQFRETGTHDVLRPAWARALFRQALSRQDGELRGAMLTLRAGGRLVAGKFGIAVGGVFHAWLSSIDRQFGACAPGQVMMFMAPQALEAGNLAVLDLGPGYAHYKAPFATSQVAIREGLAVAEGPIGRSVRSLESVWALAGDRRIEAVGRLRRRLDHIAAAETSMGGRMRGVVDALAGYGRRSSSREPRHVPEATRETEDA
jgi:CelD/BcsL family acetyltransferase involved in cellulose biosynthesis